MDRIFLHAYVPGLQTMGQVIRFLLPRGYPIPSPAALGAKVVVLCGPPPHEQPHVLVVGRRPTPG